MQNRKAAVRDPDSFYGSVNKSKEKQEQSGIQIPFVHPHGKNKQHQNQNGAEKGILFPIVPAAQTDCQYGGHNQQNEKVSVKLIGNAQKSIILADPV